VQLTISYTLCTATAIGNCARFTRFEYKLAEQNTRDAIETIQQRLAHWRIGPNLASVRERHALDYLPESERSAWQTLWGEVDQLANRVTKKNH
jgi:hypothetical protein